MRDLATELKVLRLHGMAAAWAELAERGAAETEAACWLVEHLLQVETTDRALRSVSHQMHAARFPIHRDLAGFDFSASPVDRKLIEQLAGSTLISRTLQRSLIMGQEECHATTKKAQRGVQA